MGKFTIFDKISNKISLIHNVMSKIYNVDPSVVFDDWIFLAHYYYEPETGFTTFGGVPFVKFLKMNGREDLIGVTNHKCECSTKIKNLYFIKNVKTNDVKMIGSTCISKAYPSMYKFIKTVDKDKDQIKKSYTKALKVLGDIVIEYGKYKGKTIKQVGFTVYKTYLTFLESKAKEAGTNLKGEALTHMDFYKIIHDAILCYKNL
jgi:hypothetical protein